ncbi:MAG: hypothetical protein AB8B50_20520 [Pirellulaceae bacterium]
MKNLKSIAFALSALILAPAIATAQNAVTVPINNWSYQRHSSTATEGYLRGSAAVIQAAGQKNYLDSVAAVNHQEATKRRIENSSRYVKTYFENKEINRQYREKYAPVPPSKERWARILESSLPERLTAEQFDHASGKLVWPHILRTDEYAVFRNRIDDLVASRTPDNSGNGSPAQRELKELIDGLRVLLRSNSDDYTTSQFASATWFLRSLDYEAKLPLTGHAAAAS